MHRVPGIVVARSFRSSPSAREVTLTVPLRTIALLFAASLLLSSATLAQPADAAVPPVPYTGSVNIDYVNNGSAGGVLYRNGYYYLMTVGHIANGLYTQHWVVKPGNYPLGGTAYNGNLGASNVRDIALIELGTSRPNPRLRICNQAQCPTPPGYTIPQIATIDSVPTGPDLPYGKIICHSGWSASTDSQYGGYRCGIADNTGDPSCAFRCGITNINGPSASMADGGDSGGPVWQPLPNGHVRLLGFMHSVSGSYPHQRAYYQPVWRYTTQQWTAAQSCAYCLQGAGGVIVTGN